AVDTALALWTTESIDPPPDQEMPRLSLAALGLDAPASAKTAASASQSVARGWTRTTPMQGLPKLSRADFKVNGVPRELGVAKPSPPTSIEAVLAEPEPAKLPNEEQDPQGSMLLLGVLAVLMLLVTAGLAYWHFYLRVH